MTDNELIDEIVRGLPNWIAFPVRGWAVKCERFRGFLRDNSPKIRSKFTSAITLDDKGDVLAELEYASRLMSDARFTLRYEPCGKAGPDFLVSVANLQDFHLEVKRIRETEGTHEIQRFVNNIIEAARNIPSSLGVLVCILGDWTNELGQRLCDATPAAVAKCQQAIHDIKSGSTLLPGEKQTIPIDGFEEEEVYIEIVKIPGKESTLPTANIGGNSPVAYTEKEPNKFGDHVVKCLKQLRPGTANVLAVKIDSTPHDPGDLIQGLDQLEELAVAGKDEFFRRKRLTGSEDYLDRMKLLSAVVVKSIWKPGGARVPRNLVWSNPSAAVRLEDAVVEYLRSM